MSHNNSSIAFVMPNDTNDTDNTILVSAEVRYVFQLINYTIVGVPLNIFGCITNVINIIVFIKLGLSDPVNVSFLGLAISDFSACLTMAWHHLCFFPLLEDLDLPFGPEIHYLTGGWPHEAFVRITSGITAFITLERCLCVLFPLKVKNMITSKKAVIFLVCTYLFVFACVAPVYYTTSYAWTFDEARNRSILKLAFTDDRAEVESVAFAISSVFLPITSFVMVAVCTALLVVTLRRKAKWRQNTSAGSDVSSKDKRVSKMVLFVSTLFIFCFFPILFLFAGMILLPDGFSIDGKYQNLFNVTFSLSFLLESTNASMNIFIYYKMSSKYREKLRSMFCIATKI